MSTTLPHFSTARVLVVGDVMLDRYWHGTTARISPEAPVPIVHVQQQEERPGGAGNVALNITAVGAQATLIGVTGKDAAAEAVTRQLQAQRVACAFLQLASEPTITKLRVLSRHQQLIRLDFEESLHFDPAVLQDLLQQQLVGHDVVVLSDYGKGTLVNPAPLIRLARAGGKPVLVDPKGNDFEKYRGASLITPNLSEFEAVVGRCRDLDDLVRKGMALIAELDLQVGLLVTRSEQGMTLLRPQHVPLHLPAHAREVYDVTGAGDTVIGILAAALAAGQDMVNAVGLANLAAGLTVAKLGAATVSVGELEMALHGDSSRGIYTRAALVEQVRIAKARQETIVMTNGCFDILHAGHVQYLTQARQLGDRLIVAVNDDASVKRLKGERRPINGLAERMAVLSGLQCVDWIVPFGEDTPEGLICELLPDILVKGGDYRVADIAGGGCVLQNGGRVQVLELLEGCSTTRIIEKCG